MNVPFRCPSCKESRFWHLEHYIAAECEKCGYRIRADRLAEIEAIRQTIDCTPS